MSKDQRAESKNTRFYTISLFLKSYVQFSSQQAKNSTKTSQMYTQYIQDSILHPIRITKTLCNTLLHPYRWTPYSNV